MPTDRPNVTIGAKHFTFLMSEYASRSKGRAIVVFATHFEDFARTQAWHD